MGKLGALKRTNEVEEASFVAGDTSVSSTGTDGATSGAEAAPVQAAPSAASAPRAFGFGRTAPAASAASSVDLSDTNDWGANGAPVGDVEPQSASTSASAAPGGIEAELLRVVRPQSVEEAPAAANGNDPGLSGDQVDAATAEATGFESLAGEAAPGAEAAAPPEDVLTADPLLTDMLQVAYDEDIAQTMSADLGRLLRDNNERLGRLNLSEADLRKMRQEANAEAVHQTGGGMMSSLFSALKGNRGDRLTGQIDGVGRQRQRVMDEHAGLTDAMRNRMGTYLKKDTAKRIMEFYADSTELARSVHGYNSAVLGADAATDVLEKAKAYSASTGKPLSEVASEIGSRKAPAEILQAFDAVSDEVLASDGVKEAKALLDAQEKVFGERLDRIAKQVDVLARSGDPLPGEHHKKLIDALEEIAEKSPDPIESAEKAEEFKKRMRETFEAIKATIEKIFEKIFGPAAA